MYQQPIINNFQECITDFAKNIEACHTIIFELGVIPQNLLQAVSYESQTYLFSKLDLGASQIFCETPLKK